MTTEQSQPHCFSCGAVLELPDGPIGRSATCDNCDADIRCCRNCQFYDVDSYNECREPSAERVVEKERANFCDFFSLAVGEKNAAGDPREAALKKLDDLFK